MADVRLEHVYKVYDNGITAVNDFSLSIKDKTKLANKTITKGLINWVIKILKILFFLSLFILIKKREWKKWQSLPPATATTVL